MSFELMINEFKLVIHRNDKGVVYEGYGHEGRKYDISRHGSTFIASLVSHEGPHIAATGNSPADALARAESIQRYY